MASAALRAFKWLAIGFAAVLLLLVLLAAGAWWWAGTEGSTDWVLRQVAKSQPLSAEGVRGSLRSGLTARRIAWEKDGLKVEAFDADLAWQPLALARATLKLDRLHAARLRLEDHRPPQPSRIPVSLGLPLRVEIDDVKVGQVQAVTATHSFEVSDVAGRYRYDTVKHDVKLASLAWMGGRYSGEAALGAYGKLPLEAKLQGRFTTDVPGSAAKVPLSFDATLQGPLAEIAAKAQLRGEPGTAVEATQADVQATVTPWGAQPVPQAQARFRALDVGALWPQAPRTRLDGTASVRPAGPGVWSVEAQVRNAEPGPWDQRRLPVSQAVANGEWRGGEALVRELRASAAGGEIRASGQWRAQGRWAIDASLSHVDPAGLHTAMASLPVSGKLGLDGEGAAVSFNAALQGNGPVKAAGGLELRSLDAKGRWAEGLLSLPTLDVKLADASLVASLEARPAAKSGSGRAVLQAPGLKVQAEGRIAETAGKGQASITAGDLAQALAWLSRLPGVPPLGDTAIAGGRADANLSWQGGWRDPAVQAQVNAPSLELRGQAPQWQLVDTVASVDGRLSDAALQLRGRAVQGQRRVDLQLAGRGGRRDARTNAWQGRIDALQVAASDPALGKGPWTLALLQPFDVRLAEGSLETGAGRARLASPRPADAPAQLAWDPVRFGHGELRTSGRLTGLPLGWIEIVGGTQLAGSTVSGDMVFDAQWEAQLGATPRIRASLERSRGDLAVLAETGEGRATRVAAGVRTARLAVASEGEQLTATLDWDSERGGTAHGRVATRLTRGGSTGWQWAPDAPLSGSLRAHLPRIGVWSVLAPPGWRLRGSLEADIRVAGTRSDPRLSGTLGADDLALRSVVDGIELQGGRLRARLDGQRVVIDEFTLHGPGTNGGLVSAKGEASWTGQALHAQLTADLQRLRASIRSDRQLTVSGTVSARRDATGTSVNGKLHVDQAMIVLPEQGTPRLGEDVVVRNAAAPITKTQAKAAEEAAKPADQKLQVAVDVDLGDDFRVQGMGVNTRLGGTVAVTGQSLSSPRLVGTIRARGGEYRAYGQRLQIERGLLHFTGPVDNPGLDVIAIRPNIPQRVGVQVTGTARAPFVRLFSEPDLPDAEKLAWLVTGRAAPATGAESALVQQAALALLASRSGGGKRGIAASLGLDELSFRREGASGPSLTLGKRFGEKFYAAYERSLSGALGTLFIFYDVSRRLTLRAQTGERTALDLIYTFEFN